MWMCGFHVINLRRADCSYNQPSMRNTCRRIYVHRADTIMRRNLVLFMVIILIRMIVFPRCK